MPTPFTSKYPIVSLSDYPQLLDNLVAQQWEEWGYDDPDDLKEFFAQELAQTANLAENYPKTWIMMADTNADKIIGAVTLSLNEMGNAQPTERNPWLGYLYIEPDYRGQGLAKLLTNFAVEQSVKLGFPHCYLYASDEKPRYLKWGWQSLETLEFQEEEVTVMQNPDPLYPD